MNGFCSRKHSGPYFYQAGQHQRGDWHPTRAGWLGEPNECQSYGDPVQNSTKYGNKYSFFRPWTKHFLCSWTEFDSTDYRNPNKLAQKVSKVQTSQGECWLELRLENTHKENAWETVSVARARRLRRRRLLRARDQGLRKNKDGKRQIMANTGTVLTKLSKKIQIDKPEKVDERKQEITDC